MNMTRIIVTRENIDGLKEQMPIDQGLEITPGCITWGIMYEPGGQRGQMTAWPDGRGALCLGGDSAWGDWDAELTTLYTDPDGIPYDSEGIEQRK